MTACPALLVAGCASGQGKTTVTAGLARLYRRRGLKVRVFKTGPDFLDPLILAQAAGSPVYQLDLWMVGAEESRALLYEAALEADLILVEGVMGLFDGEPSAADLAAAFGLPVLAVIDAGAMAQTVAAIAHGLATYRDDIRVTGLIANRVSSPGHRAMIEEALGGRFDFFGTLPSDPAFALPSRHLGLVPAGELADLDRRLDAMAEALERHAALPLPPPVEFAGPGRAAPPRLLEGKRIAIARDAAFCFLYQANLDLLRAMGAELTFFSPLSGSARFEADALYLPGGYPELHLGTMSFEAIRAHLDAGKPALAECGGMLALLDRLNGAPMAGVIPGEATLQPRLVNLGLHSWGSLRGHSFHHSRAEIRLDPIATSKPTRAQGRGEAVYRLDKLTATYLHLYFGSDPGEVAELFT
ncbi:MAG TPA: cobyrinate a,c-diamide synthase [Magnetospirillaceae bacterium]|nr:cobyrinate a,c-diamide synthase [Magnetospirillaceae bacterium]